MSRVRVSSVTVGQLAVNCWFLINEDTKEALVFDPGDQADKIVQYASEQGVKITAALLTHGHIDHMGGADALRNLTGAKVYALREEEDLLLDAKQNLSVYIARKVVTGTYAGRRILLLCGSRLCIFRRHPVSGLCGKNRFSGWQHVSHCPFCERETVSPAG